MLLVGQLDSPFVRRVAVSMTCLGRPFERDRSSVFRDFEDVSRINPLGRVPALVLDDGTVLVDSTAILDWLDGEVGPERAPMPPADRRASPAGGWLRWALEPTRSWWRSSMNI
jgi:glutathione S-transferase